MELLALHPPPAAIQPISGHFPLFNDTLFTFGLF